MRRFMGMMPRSEVAKESYFKDKANLTITVQAGPNGWTVLWADHSSDYMDITASTEENHKAAMLFLEKKGFTDLKPFQPAGER